MKSVLVFFILAATQPPSVHQEQIVVTAAAVPESVESTPAAVTVITRDQIERREARDVADVLREVPGLAVARTGGAGKTTTLFVRGGSSKQALVLWNGVEMNNPYFSGYNFGQLSTAGVERVEVVRGPFSALYGSEAVSGVVNVLTTPARSGLQIDVAGGERGLINLAAGGALVDDRWNAHAAFERREDDGFDANDDFQSTSILGGATLRATDQLSIGFLGRRSTYDLGIPQVPNATSSAFIPSPHRREDGAETQFAVPVRFEGQRMSFDLRLSESRRDDEFADPEGPFGPEAATTEARVRTIRGSATSSTALGMITVGGEYGRDRVDHISNFAEIDSRERTSRALFVEDRLSLMRAGGRFEVTAGLRYDDYDTFGSEVTPRIAAAWLRGGHKFRAAYGEAFRAPAIGELYFPFGGNLALGPERSSNFEIGYDLFSQEGTFSATLFRAGYDGLIVFGASGMFENVAAATANGLELAASRQLGPIDVAVSYTLLNTEDDATGDELVRRPRHSGSLALGYRVSRYDAELVVTHKGERADVTDLFPFGVVRNDAYTAADLTFRYHLGNVVPYVKLENLTGERYEEVFGYLSPGRRAVVGVRYRMR
jgi:vitamin B12 transporter